MSRIRPVLPVAALALAAALLVSCTIPSLETLSRRHSVSAAPASVTVRPGDTVYAIARRYRVPPKAVIDANRLAAPYTIRPGQILYLPGGPSYAVRTGDSLYAISRRYGVAVGDLAGVNGLRPPYTIYVGQRLTIPRPAPPPAEPVQSVRTVPSRPVEIAVLPRTPEPATMPVRTASRSPSVPPPPRRPSALATSDTPVPPRPPQLVAAQQRQIALPAIPAPQARSASGFQWPLAGEVVSRFGPKSDGRHNDGVNIAAAGGTPVVAADNGVVAYAGNELRGYGNLVLIRHDGDWVTAYGHADRLLVGRGDRVRAGQRIATVGSSGSVGSPQLHFEIRRGAVAVDPLAHLPPAPGQVGLR